MPFRNKNIMSTIKALDKLDGTVSAVGVDGKAGDAELIRESMTLGDGKTLLSFVVWVTYDDLKFTTMFRAVISLDTAYGTNAERRPLYVGAGTDYNRMNICFHAFMISECEWAWKYCYEVALPALPGK
jgi:hypothetical protein